MCTQREDEEQLGSLQSLNVLSRCRAAFCCDVTIIILLTIPPMYKGISLNVCIVPTDQNSIGISLTFHSQVGHFGQNVAQGDFIVNTVYLCLVEYSENNVEK